MFEQSGHLEKLRDDHATIRPSGHYSNDDRYEFCKNLLVHMKEEETILLGLSHGLAQLDKGIKGE